MCRSREAEACLKNVDVEIRVGGHLSKAEKEKILEMARRSQVHALVKGENSINERFVDR